MITAMKKCPFCGKEIQEDSIFCIYCENELSNFDFSNDNSSNDDDVLSFVDLYKKALIVTVILWIIRFYFEFGSLAIGDILI